MLSATESIIAGVTFTTLILTYPSRFIMAGLAAVVMYTVLSENYRCALLFNLTFYMQLIFVLDVVTPYFGLINRFLLALSNLSIVLIYEAQIHVCCFPECMHISGKMTRVICIARRHLWIREER